MNNTNNGRIAQIIGPVIDVAFDQESDLPNLLDALEITRDNGEIISLKHNRLSEKTPSAPSQWIQLTVSAAEWQ